MEDKIISVVFWLSTIIVGAYITDQTHWIIAIFLAPIAGAFMAGICVVVLGVNWSIKESVSSWLDDLNQRGGY